MSNAKTEMKKELRSIVALGDRSLTHTARRLKVMHPDDQKTQLINPDTSTPMVILLTSNESDQYEEANHENRRIAHERLASGADYDPQIEDDGVYRTQAYCSVGWEGIPAGWLDGTDNMTHLEYSRDNAFKLYKRLAFLRQQVNIGIWDRKNENFDVAS